MTTDVSHPAPRRWLLPALLIAGAAVFVVGVAAERGSGDVHTRASEQVGGERHTDGDGATEAAEALPETEKVLGVDAESTPLVVAAVVVSVGLAALTWRRGTPIVLLVTAAFALAFAALDVVELLRQLDESRTGIALLAGLATAVHLGTAAAAGARRTGSG